jgi:hypothetical protein
MKVVWSSFQILLILVYLSRCVLKDTVDQIGTPLTSLRTYGGPVKVKFGHDCFHILSNSLFILSFSDIQSELVTTSLNKSHKMKHNRDNVGLLSDNAVLTCRWIPNTASTFRAEVRCATFLKNIGICVQVHMTL